MEEETEQVATSEDSEAVDEEPLSIIEIPKNIDFVLASSLNKVVYDNMDIDNIKGELLVKDQKVSMNDLAMNLLEGSMLMNGHYETTNPKVPSFKYDLAIKGFDVQTVVTTFNTIETMAPYAKSMKGKFNTSLKVNGVLDHEMMPDLNTLTGGGDMVTKSIKVEGLKSLDKLASALKNDKLNKLELNDAHIKFKFKDGRVYTEPFDIKMGPATGKMSGSNGFDQTLDNVMTLKIPSSELGAGDAMNTLNGQAGKLGMDLKAAEYVMVDVTIKGNVADPKIGISLKDAVSNIVDDVKEQVVEKVKEKIVEVKEDLKGKAKKEADKILAEAQKQADRLKAKANSAADKVRVAGKETETRLLKEAGGNPLKKGAAKIAGKQAIKQADKQALKLEAEGDKQAANLMAKAKEKAAKLMDEVDKK
jgi:vacuolar-type H+-ATPase subunit H